MNAAFAYRNWNGEVRSFRASQVHDVEATRRFLEGLLDTKVEAMST